MKIELYNDRRACEGSELTKVFDIKAIRFGVIGASLNILSYLIFCALIRFGIDAKIAITVSYTLYLLISFILNKNITFVSQGRVLPQLCRYFTLYVSLYFLNLILIFWAVDLIRVRAELVQGVIFILFISSTFLIQKIWVFKQE